MVYAGTAPTAALLTFVWAPNGALRTFLCNLPNGALLRNCDAASRQVLQCPAVLRQDVRHRANDPLCTRSAELRESGGQTQISDVRGDHRRWYGKGAVHIIWDPHHLGRRRLAGTVVGGVAPLSRLAPNAYVWGRRAAAVS